MTTINTLYIEDEEADRTYFSNMLRNAFRNLPDIDIKIETAVSINEAESRLEDEEQSPFQLYLVDLNYSPADNKHRLLGLPFIDQLRDRFADVAIVAISSMDPKQRGNATKAGADDVLSKYSLWNDSNATTLMQHTIRTALETHGLIAKEHAPGRVEYDTTNRMLMAALGQADLEILKETITKVEEAAYTKIEIKLVSGGLSGSHTFSVKCTPTPQPQVPARVRHYLVKMGRDRSGLKREWENGREVLLSENFPKAFVLPLIDVEPKEFKQHGRSAVVGTFDTDACTLESWLVDSTIERDRLHSALEQLCLYNLGKVFSATTIKPKQPIDGYREELLGRSRTPLVLTALDELGELIPMALNNASMSNIAGGFKEKLEFDTTLVDNYLERGDLPGIPLRSLSNETVLCSSHGDLHGRNILIARDSPLPTSQLIDFSHTGALPRCTDLSTLSVSLMANCLDAGTRSYLWESIADWVQCAGLFLDEDADGIDDLSDQTNLDGSTKNRATIQTLWTLSWIVRHWRQILPDTPLWEMNLALAIQFLRLGYFSNCTAPKRVFGLIMGSIALRSCVRQFHTDRN